MARKLEEWIVEATIDQLQSAMESGEISAEALTMAYLARIERYDGKINSILEINPDALDIARALDRERKETGSRSKLHGIPILLKDNIDTHDRMHTSAGSLALADSYAAKDSCVASKLREAGAILLGKTNMTEWANFMSNLMPSGHSSRGGQVRNPYGPDEIFVGGSSSGSGAAVAANFAAAAIGTETSGSIISPSIQHSLVGIKPTIGLVSRSGIIPISHSQDSAGPIARTVTDAAIVLGAITGVDERDAATFPSEGRAFQDYTQFLDANYLQQARIGIPRFYYNHLDEARLAILEGAIAVLKEKGATIIDPVSLPCEQNEWDYTVLRYEFKKDLNDYLSTVADHVPVHTLRDVIAFNESHAEEAKRYGQDILTWSEETSGTLTEQEYIDSKAKNLELARRQGIDHALEQHQLDALLFLGIEGGSDLAARAGYPLITVPAGYAATGVPSHDGLLTKGPQGVTFVGTAYSEPTLFKIAYGFEQATKHRLVRELD